jgi:hypothetical protein
MSVAGGLARGRKLLSLIALYLCVGLSLGCSQSSINASIAAALTACSAGPLTTLSMTGDGFNPGTLQVRNQMLLNLYLKVKFCSSSCIAAMGAVVRSHNGCPDSSDLLAYQRIMSDHRIQRESKRGRCTGGPRGGWSRSPTSLTGVHSVSTSRARSTVNLRANERRASSLMVMIHFFKRSRIV